MLRFKSFAEDIPEVIFNVLILSFSENFGGLVLYQLEIPYDIMDLQEGLSSFFIYTMNVPVMKSYVTDFHC